MNPTDSVQELNVLTVALHGTNLIEASAGTGKTWTITGLFVRLLLELGLNVDQILVVTYTNAATAELRDRIRKRLFETLDALKTGASKDPFCDRIIQGYAQPSARMKAIRRLDRALRGFDEAAIFTIHGFCQRVLTESPFESGIDFEFELMPDESELIREIVADFWRAQLTQATGLWAEYLIALNHDPNSLAATLGRHAGKARLNLIPTLGTQVSGASEDLLMDRFHAARSIWQKDHVEIKTLLSTNKALNRNKFRKSSLEKWYAEQDCYFEAKQPSIPWPEKLDRFTAKLIQASCKNALSPPQHVFFDTCESLLDALEQVNSDFYSRWANIKVQLLEYCNRELPRRKLEVQCLSYNDLLNRLDQALSTNNDINLAQSVRNRYPAALIDEFQDTDPVQYNIFRSVYLDQPNPVVFVGDPKQAIYRFRGADIYSYLQARQSATNVYSLKTNRRSVPWLIDAVNALFERSAAPFLSEQIAYPNAQAADDSKTELLVENDRTQPFRILLTPQAKGKGDSSIALKKVQINALACGGTANKIAQLLNSAEQGAAMLVNGDDSRPLNGGDIAILVGTHRQGQLMQRALAERDIASVRHGQESVFQCNEAQELYITLKAIAKPTHEPLVKAALITELSGISANQLAELEGEANRWEKTLDLFRNFNDQWQNQGFMPMFRCWFNTQRIAQNLSCYRDGERRLTNVLHLGELLQSAQIGNPGGERLLTWLAGNIYNPKTDDESTLLRLESDAMRVKIVTIHSSKGLEYPVVFCPFLWDAGARAPDRESVEFHDPDDNHQITLDLGSENFEHHAKIAANETFAEKLRLLYVGLTRAKNRCYVVWGGVPSRRGNIASSALAWLLHGPRNAVDDPLATMQDIIAKLDRQKIEQDLASLVATAPHAIAVQNVALDIIQYKSKQLPVNQLRCAYSTRRRLEPSWTMNSFSGMAHDHPSEQPDYDRVDLSNSEEPDSDSIFAFPRGAIPGTCLHSILEDWDFVSTDTVALQRLIEEKLFAHGIDEKWTDTVLNTVRSTLQAPLGKTQIKLAELAEKHRLTELEFCFPLDEFNLGRFQRILSDSDSGMSSEFINVSKRLGSTQFNGYMKGFIDLVFEAEGRFYIVDYKSNWLGNSLSNYSPTQLIRPLAQHHYYVQYLIYTVAMHRYLSSRMQNYNYENHFGGVFYMFLRGVSATSTSGIYHTVPSYPLVRSLDKLMSVG